MDTFEIECIGSHMSAWSVHPQVKFAGVFAFDEFDLSIFNNKSNICCVVNTEPASEPGEHWLLFCKTKKNSCYFFDSYGFPPTSYGFAKNPLLSHSKLKLQGDESGTCGQFCLLYHYYLCSKFSPNEIPIHILKDSRSFSSPDQYVCSFISNYAHQTDCSSETLRSCCQTSMQCCIPRGCWTIK
jgi:hypothetical protein